MQLVCFVADYDLIRLFWITANQQSLMNLDLTGLLMCRDTNDTLLIIINMDERRQMQYKKDGEFPPWKPMY